MYHYRKTKKKYGSYPKFDTCDFCHPEAIDRDSIKEFKHCYVIPNRTFYDVWELRKVIDHLLVIPKYHTDSLSELADEIRLDIMNAIAKYESQSYNVYARAPGNTQKSMHHQHTHLIKTEPKPGRAALYLSKPYLLLKV